MKLLFVEDDIEIRENLRFYLKSIFREVIEVSNGKEALKEYYNCTPDIILLDINIPKLNGIEVAKKIRERDNKTVIIILTAHDDRDILIQAIELKLTKYLLKPVSRNELKQTLIKAISDVKEIQSIDLMYDYKWNLKNKILKHKNEIIKLTNNEIKLFNRYCNNTQEIFTNEDLSSLLYEEEEYNENKVRMFLKRFRKNINPELIINIYGLGYRFNYFESNLNN
ncbi:response regulator transcription factor [Arcobacter peruensis]|uniref:response regulator transcription factor n=1 Tax=Arcobacter peruensis TaxID=2320140 RepID=UPI000F08E027|nr:response regulator [Arcobacter peruensis]